jgi:glycosyltransferase involved in cell wall biosynthesis
MKAGRPTVMVLGPSRSALSGVTTHVNLLLGSPLAAEFALAHFQVGSEGRSENALAKLLRLAVSPVQLAADIVRLDAEIVHINSSLNKAYWRDLMYLGVARLFGARVVYQVHGGALPLEFQKTRLGRMFLRKTLMAPDVLIVLASRELSAYREFMPRQAVLALPNGIDCVPFLRYNRTPSRPGAPLKLVYIGRLAREKGLYETIDALALVRSLGVSARLVIAGGGPEEAGLRARVREHALKDAVSFTGPVEGDHKALLLSQADLLVLPSYAEGLPYALLEGMAAGAVPVATPVGAIPDVVTDGVHGLLVPLRDADAIAQAVARLAGDRALLARMSAASRKRVVSAYSIERVAADFSTLYSKLSAARAPRAVL